MLSNTRWSGGVSFGVFAIVVVGAGYAAVKGFVGIDLKGLAGGQFGTLMLSIFFVALVIERTVEVYANNRFDPEREAIEQKVSGLEACLICDQAALTAELAGTSPSAEMANTLRTRIATTQSDLVQERLVIVGALNDLKTRKRVFAVALSTLLGLAASVVAVRVLGQFLPMTDNEIGGALGALLDSKDLAVKKTAELQLSALRFVDIVLTTAVLAGGADGVHRIIKRFTDTAK